MTTRLGSSSCLRVFVAIVSLVGVVHAADAPEPDLSDGFTPEVRDVIQSGLATTFSYEVDLRRGSVLFDRTVASVTITAIVRFDNLTRRYQMSRTVDGRVEDARPTEDQNAVRSWMTHFERIPLSTTANLET